MLSPLPLNSGTIWKGQLLFAHVNSRWYDMCHFTAGECRFLTKLTLLDRFCYHTSCDTTRKCLLLFNVVFFLEKRCCQLYQCCLWTLYLYLTDRRFVFPCILTTITTFFYIFIINCCLDVVC